VNTSEDRLSFEDVQMLRLESAAIAGHTCKIVVVEAPGGGERIEVEELRRHVGARLGRAPRSRQRVRFAPLPIARPAWVDYPQFDIREHVRGHESPQPIDRERLLEIAAELMAQRLDHTRPLWRMDLVGPLEDGGSAIVWRIHHCMADGVTSMRLGSEILWDAEPDPASPELDRWRPAPEPSGWRLLYDEAGDRARELRGAIPGALRAATSPGRWASAGRTLGRLPGALLRELTPLGSSSSRLDRHIGPRRELGFASRAVEELREIEKAVGQRIGAHVTVNDVVLAAIGGAIGEWAGGGEARERLRAQVPVSMHHRDERPDELGNRDSFLFVDLPVHEPDPVRRVQLINAETSVRKAAHDAETLYTFFHAMSRLGAAGHELVRAASGPHEFSLSVSNVPGPKEPLYVMGGRVAELCSVAEPADRHALRVSAMSCAGTMHFALCTDPDALGDVTGLASAIERSIEELREASDSG
jgi:diacylglycerol O-acyltransferase / wax synthase